MPQPHFLKIVEIFSSIQGEGLRQGEATIFIRLAGCNLKCPFCDTQYAWKEGKKKSIPQILTKIKKIRKDFPVEWICITGGEPLLQDIMELVRALKNEHFKIQIESNATLYRPLSVDWYTISPKPDKYFFSPEYRKKAKEVKIVVTKDLNLGILCKLRKAFSERIPIFLQPQSNRKWSISMAVKLQRETLKAGVKNVRLSFQLHKIYDLK